MTTSVLVNNYQYGWCIGEAIESVAAQSIPVDEIIVVDDGSTDGSREVLQTCAASHANLRVIEKENGGQLSCFNEAVREARGDVLFFLDADDLYEPSYISRALSEYEAFPDCGFLFVACQMFDKEQGQIRFYDKTRDFGRTLISARCAQDWVGSVTSSVSMRREVAARFMPVPYPEDWRVRADDCLVWGASLAGAGKRYLDVPLVRYRVHGANHHYGRSPSPDAQLLREVRVRRLLEHFAKVLELPADLEGLSHFEFQTRPHPSRRELLMYLKIVWKSHIAWWTKFNVSYHLWAHLVKSR